jgi:mRNA-degrading endonuclease RelE of RelBE toxin-antitoxin system
MKALTFSVFITSHFSREYKKLAATHPGIAGHYSRPVSILQTDPNNRSRTHAIKKLEGVAADAGQWRIRAERFRFRYDIDGATVYLKSCALRDERTYRR